jgi:hypothetical protein
MTGYGDVPIQESVGPLTFIGLFTTLGNGESCSPRQRYHSTVSSEPPKSFGMSL